MERSLPARGEVILAGLGGGGILTAGTILAEAATARFKNVTWFPSYAISRRGGLAECTVIFSNEEIASPLLTQASGVIVAESAQFKDYEVRVRPGGMIIVESAGLKDEARRKDIKVIKIPAIKTAIDISGTSRGANLVLLGAFVKATQIIPPELVRQQIEKSFAGNKTTLNQNLKAFDEGQNLI